MTLYPTIIPQALAVFVALVAMISDTWWGRIYNWLTFPAMFTGWAVNFYLFGLPGLGFSLAATLVGIALYFPFGAFRIMGMGDVKLLGAIGALSGSTLFVISVFLYTSALGGIHAILIQYLNYGRNAMPMLFTSFSTGIYKEKTIHKENATAFKEGKFRFLLGIDIFLATLIACCYVIPITLPW
jgi:prepilin peptidase CpaA